MKLCVSSYLIFLNMIGNLIVNIERSSFFPCFKCGVGAGIAAGVGALTSSIITSASSSANVGRQLNAQSQENQLNRDWQTAEAEKARQYNTGERLATQQFQQGLIDEMNEYNSPVHQAQMFRDANLNPSIALGGQGAIVSANPSQGSSQSSPIPSGVSGLSPVGFQPLDLQIPQMLNGIGSFMKNVGEAEKLGVDTDYAKASFDMNLSKLSAEASAQEFYAAGLELSNAIRYATKDADIKKAFEEAEKVHWEALLMEKKGLTEDLQQKVLHSQEKLNQAVANYHGKNAELVALDVMHYEEAFNMKMNIGKSEINKNNATAKDLFASAEGKELLNNISRATNLVDIDNALFNADTLVLLQQSDQKEQLWQQLQRDVKKTSAYKNSENQKRIDASLEKLRQILGISFNMGASASN